MKAQVPMLLVLLACASRCQGVEVDLLTARPDLGPAPAGGCVSAAPGDGSTCRPDGDWRDLAVAGCAAGGLALGNTVYSDPCAAGSSSSFAYACCPPELLAGCAAEMQGGGAACQEASAWTAAAAGACAGKGLVARAVLLGKPCGPGLFGGTRYLCCP